MLVIGVNFSNSLFPSYNLNDTKHITPGSYYYNILMLVNIFCCHFIVDFVMINTVRNKNAKPTIEMRNNDFGFFFILFLIFFSIYTFYAKEKEGYFI